MNHITQKTKRKMLQAWGIGMVAFIPPASIAYRGSVSAAVGTIVVIPLIFATLPVIVQWGVGRDKRNAEARARRLEAYRQSPESHLLRLNDAK